MMKLILKAKKVRPGMFIQGFEGDDRWYRVERTDHRRTYEGPDYVSFSSSAGSDHPDLGMMDPMDKIQVKLDRF